MERFLALGLFLLTFFALIEGVNIFLTPLPDGLVRLNGLVLIAALAATVYGTVKRRRKKG